MNFDVRNKWHWFGAAGVLFLLAGFLAYMPTSSGDQKPLVAKPVTTRVTSLTVPAVATVFPTRTATRPPTAWHTPTPMPPTATAPGTALCPAGRAVPAGAPMWVTATGTAFSQSNSYKFEAEGQRSGRLTGREIMGLCETTVTSGSDSPAWYNPAGGK